MTSIIVILISVNASIIAASCNGNQDKTNQGSINNLSMACDTMTREAFFTLAKAIKTSMDNHEEVSIKGAVEMVKVYNTLHFAEIANDEKHSKFTSQYKEIFQRDYLRTIVKMLECSYGKGMTIYSTKYDLYVGIGSEFRCKDLYTLV